MPKKIYINIKTTKAVDGLEAFKPQPAMGNMKTSTEGYAEKYAEKVAKIDQELATNGIFSDPVDVQVLLEGEKDVKVLAGKGLIVY
jgi:hypothetical protein